MPRFLLSVPRALALVVLLALPVAGQETVDASPSAEGGSVAAPPQALVTPVRAEVAHRWQVEEDRIVLDFGRLTEAAVPSGTPSVELLGSGNGGHWIVRVASATGDVVSLHVRAGVETSLPVASRALSRGQKLTGLDMDTSTEVRWGAPAPDQETAEEGWVVQRMIRRGEALKAPAVQPPLAVESGHAVDIVWKRPGIAINLRGRALGSATLGREVFVRTESGERLRGVASAPGVVDVTPGGSDR